MEITLGTYKAVKDTSMQTGNSAWMLMDGGEIKITQIDKERSKVLFRYTFPSGYISTDWMHFSRIRKCFTKK